MQRKNKTFWLRRLWRSVGKNGNTKGIHGRRYDEACESDDDSKPMRLEGAGAGFILARAHAKTQTFVVVGHWMENVRACVQLRRATTITSAPQIAPP
jgi:hypothetical protein